MLCFFLIKLYSDYFVETVLKFEFEMQTLIRFELVWHYAQFEEGCLRILNEMVVLWTGC